MSKKKFTTGLESLFESSTESFERDSVALAEKRQAKKAGKKKKKSSKQKSKGGKNFTSDLESLFGEVVSENMDEIKEKDAARPSSTRTRIRKRAVSGLDSLIRQTIQLKEIETVNSKGKTETKRITFSLNKSTLMRFKEIAREEHSYLKDILGKLIKEYVDEHDNIN